MKLLSFMWLQLFVSSFYQIDMFYRNKWKFEEYIVSLKMVLIIGTAAQVAIDQLICLSAFLSVHKILKFLSNYKKPTVWALIQIYLTRLARLVPLYYYVFITGWAAIYWIGDGPLWSSYEQLFYKCDDYWWTNLAFVNNFIHIN